MSRSIERTDAQKRALKKAQDLHDNLKTHNVPADYRHDNAVFNLRLLLKHAGAGPEDLHTTELALQELDLVLYYQGIEEWVKILRRHTLELGLNIGTTIAAEMLASFIKWDEFDPARAGTSTGEIASLIATARRRQDDHNRKADQIGLAWAIEQERKSRQNHHPRKAR
jgi:hypothetical protein